MGCVSSRETRPSREVSERSEEANRPRDLSFDVLREMASCFGRVERGDSWSQPQKEAISKGEEKLDMYQREFTRWKMGDVDSTLDAFHQDFETKIAENPKKRGDFIVVSKAKEGGASYSNIIDINKGEIRGLSNKKESTIGWHFSEVIFNQFQLIMQKAKKDSASFDLKNWRGEWIINESTKRTAELFLSSGTNKRRFKKGSQEFIALAGTETAQSKFYLLAQHQKAFGKKEVTSITVKRQSNGHIQINYRYA